jgi:hypothetical protein
VTRSAEPEHDRRAELAQMPDWHRWVWGSPARRLGIALLFIGIAVWILLKVLLDPGDAPRGWLAGFFASPALLILFGAQLAEAMRDLVTGRNAYPPIFFRLAWRLERGWGWWVVGAYLVAVALALYLLAIR